jgi:hypothetical protein
MDGWRVTYRIVWHALQAAVGAVFTPSTAFTTFELMAREGAGPLQVTGTVTQLGRERNKVMPRHAESCRVMPSHAESYQLLASRSAAASPPLTLSRVPYRAAPRRRAVLLA